MAKGPYIKYLEESKYKEKLGVTKQELERYLYWRFYEHHQITIEGRDINLLPWERYGLWKKGTKSKIYRVDISNNLPSGIKSYQILKKILDVQTMMDEERSDKHYKSQHTILKIANSLGKRGYRFAGRDIEIFPRIYSDVTQENIENARIMLLELITNYTLEERIERIKNGEEESNSAGDLIRKGLDPILLLFRIFSLPKYTRQIQFETPLRTFDNDIFVKKIMRNIEIGAQLKGRREEWKKKTRAKLKKAFKSMAKKYFGNRNGKYLIQLDGRAKHNMIDSLIDPDLIFGPPGYHLGYFLCDWRVLNKEKGEETLRGFLDHLSRHDYELIAEMHIENVEPFCAKKLFKSVLAGGIARFVEDLSGIEFYLKKQVPKEEYRAERERTIKSLESQLYLAEKCGIKEVSEIYSGLEEVGIELSPRKIEDKKSKGAFRELKEALGESSGVGKELIKSISKS